MKITPEPRPVLAICLNPAWTKMLRFSNLRHNEVNRAHTLKECGGGKGVNVARVLRLLGFPVAVGTFLGGHSGDNLRQELEAAKVQILAENCAAPTRYCITLVGENDHSATELIEPSGEISAQEAQRLLEKLCAVIPQFGIVTISGTYPPGIAPSFYSEIAKCANSNGIPIVLDAVKNIAPTLEEGVDVLKINAAELRELGAAEDLRLAADAVLRQFPKLKWLAITNGPERAHLFCRDEQVQFHIPRLQNIVSAIGCGDCATAIISRRLAEDPNPSFSNLATYFKEALACASASCMTDTPSLFDTNLATELLAQITN